MVLTAHRPQACPGLSREPSYGAAVLCVVSPIMGMLAWRLALMIASSTFSIWYRRATFTAGSTLRYLPTYFFCRSSWFLRSLKASSSS